jgi:hypothetical protein
MTDMATLVDIVIDCAHPASVARFWAAALDDGEIGEEPSASRSALWDVDGEVRQLVDLGARVVAVRDELTVLADPEGNEFCLIR